MATATLTSKGQITIPAQVRKDLNLAAGDRVEFAMVAPGRYELVAANQNVTALKGMFARPEKTVAIEEMNRAVALRGRSAGSSRGERRHRYPKENTPCL